jgi:hypothetical protein
LNRGTRGAALRIAAAPELAAGDYTRIIGRYLTAFPELGDGRVPLNKSFNIREAFDVTLSLASVYLQAGEEAKAETLLSAAASEMRYWPQTTRNSGYGFASVDLHILRGEKDKALAALREGAVNGTRDGWRLQLLYNPNLESLRDEPEFKAVITEIEADMAAQLTRLRELQSDEESTAIPERAAE